MASSSSSALEGTLLPGEAGGAVPGVSGTGRYRVVERIAGEGEAYRARDLLLDREVSVVLVGDGAPDARVWEIMGGLSHPSVRAVYDAGTLPDGRRFVALEPFDSRTLRAWLGERRRGWRETLRVLLQAGRGLEAVHAAGLVHGAFDLDRVLVVRGREKRACVGGVGPSSTSIEAGRRADIRAFCLVAQEALPLARGIPRNGPVWLRQIVDQVLSPLGSARYPTMKALLRVLESGLERSERRTVLGVTLMVAALTGLGAAAASVAHAHARSCDGMADRLAGVWDQEARGAGERAFSTSGAPDPGTTWNRVQAALDAYSADWVASRRKACQATWSERRQSQTALSLRVACLDRQRGHLAAFTRLLGGADAAVVEASSAAALDLEPVSTCDDGRMLAVEPRRPDEAAGAGWEAAQDQDARADVLFAAARFRESKAAARSAIEAAHRSRFRALEAGGWLTLGRAEAALDHDADAETALHRAVAAAEASGADEIRARALIELVAVSGPRPARLDETLELGRQAEAVIARMGGPLAIEADLETRVGRALIDADRPEEGLPHCEKALALSEQAFGSSHPRTARTWNNAGVALDALGRFDEALSDYWRSLAIWSAALGPRHPLSLRAAMDVGQALVELNRYGEARPYLEKVLAEKQRVLGPRHRETADALIDLGYLDLLSSRPVDGLARCQAGLEIYRGAEGEQEPTLGFPLVCVGGALLALGRPHDALAPLQHALEVSAEKGGQRGDRVQADLTLAAALDRLGREPERSRALRADAERELASLGRAAAWYPVWKDWLATAAYGPRVAISGSGAGHASP